MRIALLSTCAVAVPPSSYGGTELITAELATSLTALGHDVTVFATGDSKPAGTLRYRFDTPVWPPNDLAELRHAAFSWAHINEVRERPFDLVHAHQAPSVAFAALASIPTVLTIHHARDESLLDYYLDFPDVRFVAISKSQAAIVPELPTRVVHHGLDPARYPFGDGRGGYCAFLGRLSDEKGPHLAIDAAIAAGRPLRIGGEPHWKDEEYFAREVKPRVDRSGDRVKMLGQVSYAPKIELLRGACALLFPIEWEEPFGLVMIEAMLVGTPVIAFARGSVPEVVEEGVTGFVVKDVNEMAARLRAIDTFDRKRCRERAAERWSAMRMARDYAALYEEFVHARRAAPKRMWGVGEGVASGQPRRSRLPTIPPAEARED